MYKHLPGYGSKAQFVIVGNVHVTIILDLEHLFRTCKNNKQKQNKNNNKMTKNLFNKLNEQILINNTNI